MFYFRKHGVNELKGHTDYKHLMSEEDVAVIHELGNSGVFYK